MTANYQGEMSSKREIMLEKRAIMVQILDVTSSARVTDEKICDRLQIYFQKRKHGGGDVDKVIYPLGNHPKEAVVVFNAISEVGKQIITANFFY